MRTFYEYRPEFAKKYSARLDGAAVDCVRVNPLNFEPQLFFSSRRTRGDGFYWLDQIMRSAQLFGAERYVLQGVSSSFDLNGKTDGWAAHMGEITSFCARYGVKLSLVNSRCGLYNRPGVFTELKNACGELLGALNLRAARESGYPYTMYLKDMSGAISEVYLSDATANGETCLPGAGVGDFEEIIKRLRDVSFDGTLLIDSSNFTDEEELKRSLEFVKEKVYKLT